MELLLSITLFVVFGVAFVFLNLAVGALARPKKPNPEKLSVYECGEPAVGIGWVQFDLRFYIVGLVFLVFDVEVALLYPWAVTYGNAANERTAEATFALRQSALVDMLFFFGVLLVGFAYLWRFGYLDWVRMVSEKKEQPPVTPEAVPED
jgi:NADH-quinone oxidoreductase subunit A